MLVNTYTLYSPDLDGRIAAALAATRAGIPVILLDDFENLSGWSAATSASLAASICPSSNWPRASSAL